MNAGWEELVDQFVEHNRQGQVGLWASCRDAFDLFERYGDYSRETVAVLSKECHLSAQAVYNRRDGYAELIQLFGPDSEMAQNPPISYSHLARLNHLRKPDEKTGQPKVEMTDKEAAILIARAIEGGWSVEKLAEEAEGNGIDSWTRYVLRLRRWLAASQRVEDDLACWWDLPEGVRDSLHEAKLAVETWLNESCESSS